MDPHPGTSTSNGNRHVLMSDPPIGSDIKVEEIDNIIEYHCRDGNNFNMEFTNNLNSHPINPLWFWRPNSAPNSLGPFCRLHNRGKED